MHAGGRPSVSRDLPLEAVSHRIDPADALLHAEPGIERSRKGLPPRLAVEPRADRAGEPGRQAAHGVERERIGRRVVAGIGEGLDRMDQRLHARTGEAGAVGVVERRRIGDHQVGPWRIGRGPRQSEIRELDGESRSAELRPARRAAPVERRAAPIAAAPPIARIAAALSAPVRCPSGVSLKATCGSARRTRSAACRAAGLSSSQSRTCPTPRCPISSGSASSIACSAKWMRAT